MILKLRIIIIIIHMVVVVFRSTVPGGLLHCSVGTQSCGPTPYGKLIFDVLKWSLCPHTRAEFFPPHSAQCCGDAVAGILFGAFLVNSVVPHNSRLWFHCTSWSCKANHTDNWRWCRNAVYRIHAQPSHAAVPPLPVWEPISPKVSRSLGINTSLHIHLRTCFNTSTGCKHCHHQYCQED